MNIKNNYVSRFIYKLFNMSIKPNRKKHEYISKNVHLFNKVLSFQKINENNKHKIAVKFLITIRNAKQTEYQ